MTSTAAAATSEAKSLVPRHVAIIMDGNGRWAKQRGLPRVAGHKAGAEAVRRTLQAAADAGVEVLTLYAFSSENWRRSDEEIADMTGLMRAATHYWSMSHGEGWDLPLSKAGAMGLSLIAPRHSAY